MSTRMLTVCLSAAVLFAVAGRCFAEEPTPLPLYTTATCVPDAKNPVMCPLTFYPRRPRGFRDFNDFGGWEDVEVPTAVFFAVQVPPATLYPRGSVFGWKQVPSIPSGIFFSGGAPALDHVEPDRLLVGIGVNSDAGLSGSIVLNERTFDISRPPQLPVPCCPFQATLDGKRNLLRCSLFTLNPALTLLPVDRAIEKSEETPPVLVEGEVYPLEYGELLLSPGVAGQTVYTYSLAQLREEIYEYARAEAPVVSTMREAVPVEAPAAPFTCPHLQQQANRQAAKVAPQAELGTALDNLNKLLQAQEAFDRAEDFRRRGNLDMACNCYEIVRHLCPGSRYERMSSQALYEIHAWEEKAITTEAAGEEEETTRHKPKQDQARATCVEGQVAEMLEACQQAYTDGRCAEARDLARRALALDPDCVAAHALVYRTHLLTEIQDPPPGKVVTYKPVLPVQQLLTEVRGAGQEFVIVEEEEQEARPCGKACPAEKGNVLRQVLEAVGPRCTEVDCSKPGLPRVRCQLQVGSWSFDLRTDEKGHGSLAVGLIIGGVADAGARQRAHNEAVLRWIDKLNSGGCEEEQEFPFDGIP